MLQEGQYKAGKDLHFSTPQDLKGKTWVAKLMYDGQLQYYPNDVELPSQDHDHYIRASTAASLSCGGVPQRRQQVDTATDPPYPQRFCNT